MKNIKINKIIKEKNNDSEFIFSTLIKNGVLTVNINNDYYEDGIKIKKLSKKLYLLLQKLGFLLNNKSTETPPILFFFHNGEDGKYMFNSFLLSKEDIQEILPIVKKHFE